MGRRNKCTISAESFRLQMEEVQAADVPMEEYAPSTKKSMLSEKQKWIKFCTDFYAGMSPDELLINSDEVMYMKYIKWRLWDVRGSIAKVTTVRQSWKRLMMARRMIHRDGVGEKISRFMQRVRFFNRIGIACLTNL